VRRVLVIAPMAWQKCDFYPLHIAYRDFIARRPVGRLNVYLLDMVNKRVKS